MTEEDDGDEEEGEDEVREEGVKVAAVDGKCDLDGSVENIIATIQANACSQIQQHRHHHHHHLRLPCFLQAIRKIYRHGKPVRPRHLAMHIHLTTIGCIHKVVLLPLCCSTRQCHHF